MTVEYTPEVEVYTDPEGRDFGSVHVTHPGSRGLVVHFSAFFGKWGDAKPYRDRFQGYFHRLKMLGTSSRHDWLFLCDAHGAFDNGCYYAGEAGDLFVERAMHQIIGQVMDRAGAHPSDVVMMGSSMGATAALKFGLELDVGGIVAVSPHIDLDISAARQNRMTEVSWICPDGDALAPHNHPYTRRIRHLVATRSRTRPLPRLFAQSTLDDDGVHHEQVLPLVAAWDAAGGRAELDERAHGGHTSDYATRSLLLDAIGCQLEGRDIDVERYQTDPDLVGTLTVPPLSSRVRRTASLTRKRLLGRESPAQRPVPAQRSTGPADRST